MKAIQSLMNGGEPAPNEIEPEPDEIDSSQISYLQSSSIDFSAVCGQRPGV